MIYVRPLVQTGAARPDDALPLAGGWCWFTHVELLERGAAPRISAVTDVPADMLRPLTKPCADWAGLSMATPRLMGILNVTPDSFSDGGQLTDTAAALARARAMADEVDILDIGGESTRPGAVEVAEDEEIRRTVPLIAALRAGGIGNPISIDTRKAAVAKAALEAGAVIVNDVSGLTHDPAMASQAASVHAPVVIMHSLGTPVAKHDNPHYDDVLLDIYDALAVRIAAAVAAGIDRENIAIDPGIGFGKTRAHDLDLLRGIAIFHGLGVPILLGVSRKRIIGTISGERDTKRRAPGSIAVGLAAIAQGVQILRVHDTAETAQALSLWRAVTGETSFDA